jgi:protein-disulfide isomerase
MDDDRVPSRRAFLGGVAVALTGGGVVYGTSLLGASDEGGDAPVSIRAPDRTVTMSLGDQSVSADLSGNPVAGPTDAPVTIFYWTDFQCPFCHRFETETLPKLVEDYVAPGDVRLVFLQFPYIGEDSHTAAKMSKCVLRQVADENPETYWNWHTTVFENQGKERSGWASRANLLDLTRSVEGVDASAVDECLRRNGEAVSRSVTADRRLGERFGVRGTPGFLFYNPESGAKGRITGAQPYERFEKAIERTREAGGGQ